MHPMLTIAKRAADAAAKLITRQYDQGGKIQISSKQPNDFVSEVDIAAEHAIISVIRESFPDHAILAEESLANTDITTTTSAKQPYCWVIDPIDGTANFIKGFPHFAISIGLLKNNKLEAGLVYQPITDELFMAARGQGATLNGHRIRVSETPPENAIIATGLPFKTPDALATQIKNINAVFNLFPDIRRTGSAALDLCYVASGRVDGYFELGLSPWDIAAGALIAQESGAIVSDIEGNFNYLDSGNIIAAPAKVYKKLIKTLHQHA